MDELNRIVSMIASVATTVGIFLALLQLRQNRKLKETEFSDSLDREYRNIIKKFPYQVLAGLRVSDRTQSHLMDDYYRYFDFCNSEISMRKEGRLSRSAWENIRQGISYDISRPMFSEALAKVVGDNEEIFEELRTLSRLDFKGDPRKWNRSTLESSGL